LKLSAQTANFDPKIISNISGNIKANTFALPQSMPQLNKKATQAKQQHSKSKKTILFLHLKTLIVVLSTIQVHPQTKPQTVAYRIGP
jgi:zona occludens toxin (predicted ATPase)